MLNFDFLEKGPRLVSPPNFVYVLRKLSLLLNSINCRIGFPIVLEILGNMSIKIICFIVYGVINSLTFSSCHFNKKKFRTKI